MAERIKNMATDVTSPETGSPAISTTPTSEASSIQTTGSDVNPEPLSAEDAQRAIREAMSITSPQQTGTSITPENFTTGPIGTTQTPGTIDPQAAEIMIREGWEGGPPPPSEGGGGGRGPEGPRGPEQPWNEGDIWSPEFRRDGIFINRGIIALEALPYEIRYNTQNGPVLREYYRLARVWKNLDRKRANNRQPFKPLSIPYQERSVSEQVTQAEPAEQIDLTDLDLLVDKKDKDGNITQKGLLTRYKERKKAKAPAEEIQEFEKQLSEYFKEAKRINLLDGVDECLRLLYGDIMRGVYPVEKNRRLTRPEIWKVIRENQAIISDLGKTSFEALEVDDPDLVQEKLDGVWDVYTELAIDRFSLLLNGGGLTGKFNIDGEFESGGESLEELNHFAITDEHLRSLYNTNEDLRRKASETFNGDDEEDLREEEFRRLVSNREKDIGKAMHDRQEALSRTGEDRSRYRQMAEESELYWQPTYASYFEVFARNPEQFQIATETFIQWLRSGLTKSPNEIFQRARGFIDALTTAGQRERANVSGDFMIGLRWELEAMVAVMGANHANENYKVDYYEQFMNFGAADEGPQRLVRLSRAYRGKLGPILHKFDNDPRIELLHSPHGSRGQFMETRDPLAWEELQEQVKNLLISEVMGLEIKNYHPDDPNRTTKADYQQMIAVLEYRLRQLTESGSKEEIKEISEAIEDLRQRDPIEDNLEEIANFHSDEDFKNLYEGFDLEEQNRLYTDLVNRQKEFRRFNIAQRIQEQLVSGMPPGDLQGEELEIYEQLSSGRQFSEVSDLRQDERVTLRRLERVRKIQGDLANGMNPSELKGEDRRLYQEAKNAVDTALELYGVMAEKARRGGGVFLVDRNTHIEAYQKLKDIEDNLLSEEEKKSKRIAGILMQIRKGRKINESELNSLSEEDQQFFATLTEEEIGDFVDYLPNFKAEKWVHFAENWTKATYGGELDPEIQEKLKLERQAAGEAQLANPNLSPEERRKIEGWMNPKGIFADELQYRVDQARRMAIWSAKTYGFNAKLWDFTLLRDGKPIDPNTLGYVKDSLGVPYGINHNGENDVVKHKYAVPENSRILGYNSKGEGVILVFDNEGKPVVGGLTGLEFDPQTGEANIFDKPADIVDAKGKVTETKNRIIFDNLKVDTVATKSMQIKTPRLKRNEDGTVYKPQILTYNPNGSIASIAYGKPIVEGVDVLDVNFDRATNHIYSRWTGHPYWGYQEEDTGLILTEDAFEDAKKIRQGLLRPEDAEPHATQLLIVDPTLQRVTHFKHRESREDKILLDAVEDSYQGQWLIQDELSMAFFPENADDEYNRIAYVEQDWGGSTKIWLNPKAIYARWTDMLGRRGRTMLPVLPLHFSSMAGMWGADGAFGVLRMMNYGKLGEKGSYRMVGQFALEKWIGQTEAAQDVFGSLTGYDSPQEKRDREGYLEKPTDDADVTLEDYRHSLSTFLDPNDDANENLDIKLMADIRKTRGRKETVIQRGRVLETSKRGEHAPRWLKGVDVFVRNYDGSIKTLGNEKVFNGRIDDDRDVGSSRHSMSIFFWRDVVWIRSNKRWEGQETYENVKMYYELMDLPQIAERRLAAEAKAKDKPPRVLQSRWVQEHSKEVR